MALSKTTISNRGTSIIKLWICDKVEEMLENINISPRQLEDQIGDGNGYIYISNGFLSALEYGSVEEREWHHYFKKDEDGNFYAGKYCFNRQITFI